MKFGEKVRDLRKKHSLTQDELAQCLGINKRTIIGWERDGRYPRSVEMLEKMADIFHVPLTYLQPDQSLFIERAAEAYGKKGKTEAQHLAFELTELFASGELTPQDMDGIMYEMHKTSVYKGYKQDKIEMRGDRAEMSDFPLYLNTVAGGLDRRDQTIGGFSFVVKIYAVPVVEIIG